MTDKELAPNYPISNLTVTELETLITKIVQKVIREENSSKKATEEVIQLETNHSDEEKKPRPYGQWRGQVQMSDDFDVLPESIAAAFAGEDVTTNDEIDQQLTALRDLLKRPPEERQAILAKHAATIAEYFVPGSEEIEWAEEYVEDSSWDD